MNPAQWKAVIGRTAIATLAFMTLGALMIGDQLAQPETSHVPRIEWRLEHADS